MWAIFVLGKGSTDSTSLTDLLEIAIIVMSLDDWMMSATVNWAFCVAGRGALDGAIPVCYLVSCMKKTKKRAKVCMFYANKR